MPNTEPVLLQITDHIARIHFNRPDMLNAVNQAMSEAFLAAIKRIASTPDVRVVLLRGEGRAFMAGGDLRTFQNDPVRAAGALIGPFHEALNLLTSMEQVVLVSLHGSVMGGGLSLALAADLAIAADDTVFSLPYTRLGTSFDAGSSWNLPRVVGLRKAMEIALLADTFDASEALRLSIVNKLVPAADLATETERLLLRLASGASFAYGAVKTLLRTSSGRDFGAQLDAERAAFEGCAATADFKEGISAYFEKRRPAFNRNN